MNNAVRDQNDCCGDEPWLELRAGEARAVVLPDRGGRLASLRVAGQELLGAGVMGGGAPESWFFGCFPMAPFAGRLTADRVVLEGDAVTMPRPAPSVEVAHGVVDDVPWEVVAVTDSRVQLRVDIPEPWPFGGWVEQEVRLQGDRIELVLRCGNEEREMPVSLGYHPWFRRVVAGARAELRLQPEARFEALEPGIFGEPVALEDEVAVGALDQSFVHPAAPEIAWGDFVLTLNSSSGIWHVFDAQRPALCVEPVTAAPDGIRPGRAQRVSPSSPAELRFEMRWSQG